MESCPCKDASLQIQHHIISGCLALPSSVLPPPALGATVSPTPTLTHLLGSAQDTLFPSVT